VFPECQRCLSFVLPSRLVAVRDDDEVDKERCRAPCSRLFHWCSAGRPQRIPGDLLSRFRETLPVISGTTVMASASEFDFVSLACR